MMKLSNDRPQNPLFQPVQQRHSKVNEPNITLAHGSGGKAM
jgi:hypothetical protein